MSDAPISPNDRILMVLGQIETALAQVRAAKRALVAVQNGNVTENDAGDIARGAAQQLAEVCGDLAATSSALESAIQPRLAFGEEA